MPGTVSAQCTSEHMSVTSRQTVDGPHKLAGRQQSHFRTLTWTTLSMRYLVCILNRKHRIIFNAKIQRVANLGGG
jgi:hypothetical protein